MESRVETSRLIFAAVAFATLASTTSLARHGAGKPASSSGAAHHGNSASSVTTEPAVNAAGVGAAGNDAGSKTSQALGGTGAARHGIDLVRPDDGYASPGLRRRATRSALIAKSDKRHPTIVLPMNLVVHPPTSPAGAQVPFARSAIGVALPGTSIQNPGVTRQFSSVNANAGNAGEAHHGTPQPVAMAGASLNPTGLNGAAMGHPASSPAVLGGPAHITAGLGGASLHPKH
jgi:hypothetical protein